MKEIPYFSTNWLTLQRFMEHFVLADNQGLTREGLKSLCLSTGAGDIVTVDCKQALVAALQQHERAIVLLDYTLFDFTDISDLINLHLRFPDVHWILVSEDLSNTFVRRMILESQQFSMVTKSGDIHDIDSAIRLAIRRERFICHQITEQILASTSSIPQERQQLTPTEMEVLKEIALGKTTKEIAQDRHSSFHTINTHRKNIFHKLDVNTAYEAIRYAMRAGWIDTEGYSI